MSEPNGSLRNKTSFYYPMLLLPSAQRQALLWLYRLCREADDIADGVGPAPNRAKRLIEFKKKLLKAWAKGTSDHPLIGPYLEASRPFKPSLKPLLDTIAGCQLDIRGIRFKKFKQLHDYALQVAGGPGLASMEIFGFKDDRHRRYALDLGMFLQLTNVTRDIPEDFQLKRRYLPEEDLIRFGLPLGVMPHPGLNWDRFVRFQLERALFYWKRACSTLDFNERGHLVTAEAIAGVYLELHGRLANNPGAILKGRVKLSTMSKIISAGKATIRCICWKGLLNS